MGKGIIAEHTDQGLEDLQCPVNINKRFMYLKTKYQKQKPNDTNCDLLNSIPNFIY